MTIYFTKYTGDSRNIDKWDYTSAPLTARRTVDVYNTTSLLAPQVVLDYNQDIIDNNYNYCYINKYQRYYYITDMAADNGKKIILTLAVDPLNTWKTAIKNSPVNVIRWQGARNSQIYDSQYPVDTTAKWYVQLDGYDVLTTDTDGYRFVLGVNSVRGV